MVRILLVDDHAIFRSGLQSLLADESDLRVTAQARDGTEMLKHLRADQFDLVLLDINLPGRNGLEVMKSTRGALGATPVLMLSMYPEDQFALAALRSGAQGYITKDSDADELIKAVRSVAGGGRYLCEEVAKRLLWQFDAQLGPAHEKLSPREYQIFMLIAGGMSLTDIGERIFISVKTVSTYRTRILEKLGMGSNAALVRYAVQNGLIS